MFGEIFSPYISDLKLILNSESQDVNIIEFSQANKIWYSVVTVEQDPPYDIEIRAIDVEGNTIP
ncbi:hypothetical protein [Amphibacillus sediminis]|uniref:hypothetical protein n=1 Tax=Amphibacillus sediminis TaxID=360185 RepID=UPI0008346294|nr:hypothetical protein [Amphibacillus sediminis]